MYNRRPSEILFDFLTRSLSHTLSFSLSLSYLVHANTNFSLCFKISTFSLSSFRTITRTRTLTRFVIIFIYIYIYIYLSLPLSRSRSLDAAVKSLTGIISTSQRVKTTVSTTYCIVILEFSTVEPRGTAEPSAIGSERVFRIYSEELLRE